MRSGTKHSSTTKAAISASKIGQRRTGWKHSAETRARLSAAAKARATNKHGEPVKGWRIATTGYVEFTRGEHKGRLEHDVVMEQMIGRRLLPGEVVHHKDRNRQNNGIENLQLMTRSEHTRLHRLADWQT